MIIRSDTGERDDKFEYPIDAIREAVINSIVHRDYSTHTESSYISIKMYNDRLEISNPGGLYGNLTIEELNDVINPPVRNKTLIRILEETDKIENRSSGIATMIMAMRDLRLEPPIFENKRGNFNVIFKNHTLMTKEDREWLNNIREELSENEAYALIYLRNNDKITNGDYQKINNVNRDKALQELKVLIKKSLIEVNGIGSGSYYKLKDNIKEAQDDTKEVQGDIKETEICIECKKNDFNKTEIAIIEKLKVGELSKREISLSLGYESISGNIKRCIESLLKKNIIELTIPEKPNSKNKKYKLL